MVTGRNEFFIRAIPQDSTNPIARAIRVRILRDGQPLTDETLWSEPGDVVEGAVVVEVPAWAVAEGQEDAAADADGGLHPEGRDG